MPTETPNPAGATEVGSGTAPQAVPAAATAPPAGPVETAAAPSPVPATEATPAAAPAPQPVPASTPATELVGEPASAAAAAKPAEFPPTALDGGLTPPKAAAKPTEPAKPEASSSAAKPAEGEAATPAEPAAAGEQPAAAQPIDYAFTFPEDIKPDQINTERLTELKTALQGEKVKPEVAQKLLDLHMAELREITPKIAERLQSQSWDNFRTTTNGWLTELKSDPVVGGARFETAMRTIATVIEQYLPPDNQKELRDRLRATGMGNDRNLALLLHTFGAMMGREPPMIPASEPRQRPLNRQERGMARYNGSTPAPR
jgi:hypothetical protein